MEDAAELRFGEDFNNALILYNTEVAIVAKQMIDQRRENGQQPAEHLRMILDHVTRFDYMRADQATVQDMRSHDLGLHPFELVQINNLGCEEVDEAKTLIPSLRLRIERSDDDFDDDQLQAILDKCAAARSFDEGAG